MLAHGAVLMDVTDTPASLDASQFQKIIVGPGPAGTPPNPPAQGGNYPGVASLIVGAALGSGALISPTVVLTAAHVVESFSGSGTVNFFGASRTISSVSIHPLWTSIPGGNLNYDLAYVTLSSAVTIQPYSLYTLTNEAGQATEMVGYGQTNDSSYGVKRLGFNEVDASYTFVPGFINLDANGRILVSDFDGDNTDHSTWSGDSGGPLFINGQVAGIASWISDSTPSYNDFFGHVRVSSFTSNFLSPFVPIATYVPEPGTMSYGLISLVAIRWIRARRMSGFGRV
jgi:secreted trypsin-like serine protease